MEKGGEQAPDPADVEERIGRMAMDGLGAGPADQGDHAGSAEFGDLDDEGGNPDLPGGPSVPRGRRR